ncbi:MULTISPECIES: ABC transporter ATP-binding protein [Acidobacterium]|uniref:ABC transporter, ATP-binding protein n=1 Tax=Acidobacterium capsulatum (strain ATCC 51196 / DSM 11244 / BCRC 80197 / JCM 7670 / NBRC 15755 / NCIMB 13165 / 161) TaxID=240015 RepID=C1F9Y6_ACIC5|nr:MULTISPECIES: ABC transporter ATP-binding protein [Acidobacterium]ACO33634.1 ABC transporter, ATP-binding protein [Acidobacterium capsulatum ATCC 51196]HCT62094.1 ABC transporter ATP-binding protein [Acidobacterium sp.]
MSAEPHSPEAPSAASGSTAFTSQVAAPQTTLFLEMQHVDVARGENIVLHDVSLRIARGEQMVILGPNGCGKSTLIKTITRECYPIPKDGSCMRLFGYDRWVVSELRQYLGVVEQTLPSERTPTTRGRDVVIAGLLGTATLWPHQTVTAEMRERADTALGLLDAHHLAEKLVGRMSAGEQRRVLIARALVHAPEMLLLDEPSNALDMAAQQELREVLRSIAGMGIGILMVTHHLGDILPEMDRVLMLRAGRIYADAPKHDLITPQIMADLFGAQVEIVERNGYLHAW